MRIQNDDTLESRLFPERPDYRVLTFSAREYETLRRAAELVDKAREMIRAEMGEERFEDSPWYTLNLDDCQSTSGPLDKIGWSC